MQQQAAAFHENTTLIELKRDNKIDATARLGEVFADCRAFLSKELDPAMKALFALHDPEFLSLYLKAREVNYRTRHRNPETTDADLPLVTLVFTDAETHQPVEGVSVAINGVINSEISDAEGELYPDTLEPGSYHVAAAVPGYQSIEWDTPPSKPVWNTPSRNPSSPEDYRLILKLLKPPFSCFGRRREISRCVLECSPGVAATNPFSHSGN